MSRDDAHLLDVLQACRRALEFLEQKGQEGFLRDYKTQSAVLHQLMLLGEATKRLSQRFREGHPEIDWKSMAGLRDKLIHAYDRVDLIAVWQYLQQDIPKLIQSLESINPGR